MSSNVRPMGLTHHAAQAIHQSVDQVLDRFTVTALETLEGGEALERELVDAVRRWAARREEVIADELVDMVDACEVGTGPNSDPLPIGPSHPIPDEAVACACSLCMKAIGAVETCSICGSTDSGGRWHHDVKHTVCDSCFYRWPGAGAG